MTQRTRQDRLRKTRGVMFSLLLCLVGGLGLAGCETWEIEPIDQWKFPPPPWETPAPKVQAPSYVTLAEAYNRNLVNLEQFWARALVSVNFEDQQGRTRYEQGDGHLIFVLPHRTALSLGKMGRVLFWAGSNEEAFWIFDLLNEPTVAYFAQHGASGRADSLLQGLTPDQMLRLIGAIVLPTDEQTLADASVEVFEGDLLIDLPRHRLRLQVDAQNYLPLRVDWLDEEGKSTVVAHLSSHEPAEMQGVAPGGWPRLATDITLSRVGSDDVMRLQLSDPGDGRRLNRINPRAFDYDVLRRAYRPQETIVIE